MSHTDSVVKSRGHIMFWKWDDQPECEFYVFRGDVLRASLSGVIDIDSGYRLGGRFFCKASQWQDYAASAGVIFPKAININN